VFQQLKNFSSLYYYKAEQVVRSFPGAHMKTLLFGKNIHLKYIAVIDKKDLLKALVAVQ
jgi:hypothetical protein